MLEKKYEEAQQESGLEAADHPRLFELIVNGTPENWRKSTISYDEVVRLAFPSDPSPTTIYAVTYKRGPKANPEGSLVQGESVRVKSGMNFHVSPTGQS